MTVVVGVEVVEVVVGAFVVVDVGFDVETVLGVVVAVVVVEVVVGGEAK